jgi:hypothetical protein
MKGKALLELGSQILKIRASAGAMLAIFILASSVIAHAQTTGTMVGTVQDPSGAMVPNAAVKVISADTGIVHPATTNAQGQYTIERLQVGTYNVEVTATSFKKFIHPNVAITVDQTQRIDAVLAVGESTETVTVDTAPPLVNTSTSEVGRTLEASELTQLPLPNRNAYTELSLTPGVLTSTASGGGGGSYGGAQGMPGTDVVIAGGYDGHDGSVGFYLDGGLNMVPTFDYGAPSPNPDALQEFRVETNNFDPQYGRYQSGVVTVITKSGTDTWHGSVFEFVRNTILNDTPWGAPLNPLTGAKANAPYHRNNFGGSIGGSFKLHGNNKLYVFFSPAALRQITQVLVTGAVVPTALERQGDFTQSAIMPNNPGTKTPAMGTNSSPNCQVPTTGCLSSSLFDKSTGALLADYIPLPNAPGNKWAGYFPSPYNNTEYLTHIDDQLTANNHLSGSLFILSSSTLINSGNLIDTEQTDKARQYNLAINDSQVFKSGIVNQLGVYWLRNFGHRVNSSTATLNGATRPNSLSDLGSTYVFNGGPSMAQMNVSGYFNLGQSAAGPVAGANIYTVRDTATKVVGKHSFEFGAELLLEKDVVQTDQSNWGAFAFATSAAMSTGNTLADFLAGNPNTLEEDASVRAYTNSWTPAIYLRDNFRVTQRLTLDLGVRYDFQTPPTDPENRLTTMNLSNLSGTSTTFPGGNGVGAPNGIFVAGDPGIARGIAAIRYHHISPRVGVAYDLTGDGKTALRAGVGVFYGGVGGQDWNAPETTAPGGLKQQGLIIRSVSNVYAATLDNGQPSSFPSGIAPFPYIYTRGVWPSAKTFGAISMFPISRDYQFPLSYQFNLTIQRQLPGNTSVTVAYVGNTSDNLPWQRDVNYGPWQTGATSANENARRPIDTGYLAAVNQLASQVRSNYNSLQISANKRMSHNFSAGGFFVWGHQLQSEGAGAASSGGGAAGGGDFAQNWNTLTGERSSADANQALSASVSGIWDLTYYRGTNKLIRALGNGWQISPVVYLHSGLPISLLSGTDGNADGISTDRPNSIAGQKPTLDPHRSRPQAAAEWFNIAAFAQNGAGIPGGIGPGGADGNVSRNSLVGPGYRDVDLGIFRSIPLWREAKLQIRAEATNAFNLVSLGTPNLQTPQTENTSGVITKPATGGFGTITSAAGVSRQIQLGARLTF